jgi:uncharacterized protein YuzE
MNSIKYDPETDSAYLKVRDGEYVESEEISDGVILDYDRDDNVIAVELLGVAQLNVSDWQKLQPRLPEVVYGQLQKFFANPVSA